MALPDQVSLLCRAIRKKGQLEAEKILGRAREEAEQMVQDAEQRVRQEHGLYLARRRQDAFQQARKLEDEASLKARQLILRAREELLQDLFQEARQQLASRRDGAGYPELLRSLALQGIRALAEERVWLQVSREDQSLLTQAFCRELEGLSGVGVDLFPEPAAISGGCLVYSVDKRILVDFSFSALLKRAQPRLRELLARELLEEQ
ncbi:V-type ATP synthase subunit E [Desulfogranum mediterraneum]|uniref:V-type ATP synthase subunit E n=1 Tax=Desulfogranum mediterraneum TaxID=160661 RepID=UPI000429D454|nr:V-type ATP synthase subunit E family protein [Desulfogranum mediterraneum]